ncbi:tetraspanin 36 isoform X2 [Narcine bancroftii]|uniref:tetraspanin 36 isoform X2 n=1 Tax=Narcine bancroftii TaxID=1343680 RepID=UPI003831E88B
MGGERSWRKKVVGAVLVYVGAAILSTYKNYAHFFENQYPVLPAMVIIGIAFVMFVIGFVGCCATLVESRCGLGLFLFILLVIFATEVSIFVLGIIYRRQAHENVTKAMSLVFKKYDGKNAESRAVDYLQRQMNCCGIFNHTYWEKTQWFQKSETLPLSCCKSEFSNCTGNPRDLELISSAGCESKLEKGLETILSYAMLIILAFAIIQIFSMISICVLVGRRNAGYQLIPSAIYA